MTYQAHIENGAIVLDAPVTLPEGAKVELEISGSSPVQTDNRPFLDWIVELANSIPEEELLDVPTDGSINHDHYLYGWRNVSHENCVR